MGIEIGDPNKGSISALTRLGSEWCVVVLTALGTIGSLTSAGIAISDLGKPRQASDTRRPAWCIWNSR
jgi:hypothetical protein